jgi:hypothetical protein
VTTFTGFDMFLQISLRSKGATAFRAPVLDGFHMSLSLQNCYITAFQFTWFALLVAAVPPRVLIIPWLPSDSRVGKVSEAKLFSDSLFPRFLSGTPQHQSDDHSPCFSRTPLLSLQKTS